MAKLILFLIMSASVLFAQVDTHRILVTKTSKKTNLTEIQKSLEKINVKMYVKNHNKSYYVYSPKYKSKKQAEYALKKIKKLFPHAKTVSSTKKLNAEKKKKKKKAIFVKAAIGTTSFSDGNISDAKSYMIEAGYNFYEDLSISAIYLSSSSDEIAMSDIYCLLSYKYQLPYSFSLEGGALLGITSLELVKSEISTPSVSVLYGASFRVNYEIIDGLDVFAQYQALFKSHSIIIDDKLESFDMNGNLIGVGVGYRF